VPATKTGFFCLALYGIAFVVPAAAQQASSATAAAVLDRYCKGCHNDNTKAAGLSTVAASLRTPEENPDAWEKIVTKLRHRHMPPVGLPRSDERTYDAVAALLETALDRQAAAHPVPGRTGTFRRLIRVEVRSGLWSRSTAGISARIRSSLEADLSTTAAAGPIRKSAVYLQQHGRPGSWS
jgi:mono/diheme cytochrome c family protein